MKLLDDGTAAITFCQQLQRLDRAGMDGSEKNEDAEMVYNRYSHALDAERKKLAMSLDNALYSATV